MLSARNSRLLKEHQRDFCPIVNGELDEKVWKRKGGKIIRKNAIQDTARPSFQFISSAPVLTITFTLSTSIPTQRKTL